MPKNAAVGQRGVSFGGTVKDGAILAQERQHLDIRCDELKLIAIKTHIDSLHQDMMMQKELMREDWVPEETKKTMLLDIMALKDEIKEARKNLEGFMLPDARASSKVVDNFIDLTTGTVGSPNHAVVMTVAETQSGAQQQNLLGDDEIERYNDTAVARTSSIARAKKPAKVPSAKRKTRA